MADINLTAEQVAALILSIGDKSKLKTADKQTIVDAINEVIDSNLAPTSVLYTPMNLSNESKVQARENIDAEISEYKIPLLYDSYLKGARGVVATPTSCGAGLFVKMWDEFTKGDLEAARKTHQHIIALDNAIDSGFCASAKYLVSLQGVNMKWYTRGSHNLSPARLRSIGIWHDWAKEEGILEK